MTCRLQRKIDAYRLPEPRPSSPFNMLGLALFLAAMAAVGAGLVLLAIVLLEPTPADGIAFCVEVLGENPEFC